MSMKNRTELSLLTMAIAHLERTQNLCKVLPDALLVDMFHGQDGREVKIPSVSSLISTSLSKTSNEKRNDNLRS